MAELGKQDVKRQGVAEGYLQLQKEQERKRAAYPLQLLHQRHFDRSDPAQNFYRFAEKINSQLTMMKLGWKVVELRREQEDLALFCFGLLQAESRLPLKIFGVTRQADSSTRVLDLEGRKDIWMETQIMLSDSTRNEQESNVELGVYRFCQVLLPLLQQFVEKYLSWEYMSGSDYEDTKVISRFREDIVNRLPELAAAERRRQK